MSQVWLLNFKTLMIRNNKTLLGKPKIRTVVILISPVNVIKDTPIVETYENSTYSYTSKFLGRNDSILGFLHQDVRENVLCPYTESERVILRQDLTTNDELPSLKVNTFCLFKISR